MKCQAAGGDIVPIEQKTGIEQFAERLATLFPLWVFIGATIGITNPPAVTWLDTEKFTYGLGFLMLSMGLTLTFDDFRKCMKTPWPILVGFLAQYIVKPVLGYFIAKALNLNGALATGLILVSCCPGG